MFFKTFVIIIRLIFYEIRNIVSWTRATELNIEKIWKLLVLIFYGLCYDVRYTTNSRSAASNPFLAVQNLSQRFKPSIWPKPKVQTFHLIITEGLNLRFALLYQVHTILPNFKVPEYRYLNIIHFPSSSSLLVLSFYAMI